MANPNIKKFYQVNLTYMEKKFMKLTNKELQWKLRTKTKNVVEN